MSFAKDINRLVFSSSRIRERAELRSKRLGARFCFRLSYRDSMEKMGDRPLHVLTGGAGFIGSNIAANLDDQGADVVVIEFLRSR